MANGIEVGYVIADETRFLKNNQGFTTEHRKAYMWKKEESAQKVLSTCKKGKKKDIFVTFSVRKASRRGGVLSFENAEIERAESELAEMIVKSEENLVKKLDETSKQATQHFDVVSEIPVDATETKGLSRSQEDIHHVSEIIGYSADSLLAELEKINSLCTEETLSNLGKAYDTMNLAIVDIEHKYEFTNFEDDEGNQLAVRLAVELQNARRKRRAIKDTKDLFERLLRYRGMTSDMITDIIRYNNHIQTRTYYPRVRDDLFENN